jgi:hypothetical protein
MCAVAWRTCTTLSQTHFSSNHSFADREYTQKSKSSTAGPSVPCPDAARPAIAAHHNRACLGLDGVNGCTKEHGGNLQTGSAVYRWIQRRNTALQGGQRPNKQGTVSVEEDGAAAVASARACRGNGSQPVRPSPAARPSPSPRRRRP